MCVCVCVSSHTVLSVLTIRVITYCTVSTNNTCYHILYCQYSLSATVITIGKAIQIQICQQMSVQVHLFMLYRTVKHSFTHGTKHSKLLSLIVQNLTAITFDPASLPLLFSDKNNLSQLIMQSTEIQTAAFWSAVKIH
jgi:hypothetical protein